MAVIHILLNRSKFNFKRFSMDKVRYSAACSFYPEGDKMPSKLLPSEA
uniref:Uncharacterized protein n=1 Tax=uncultured Desulfobacterium sp. TaxID=201089 RepID=E1Y9R9_9BACT|nr:unknown protein [uncultured Desulfobacterium sp.]CBX28919.1 unknown protein [uncultured Desulfobacterium sp.]